MLFRLGLGLVVCATLTVAARDAHATCVPATPNGILNPAEACDDGNSTNGDGCSSTCTIEANWTCDRPVSFSGLVDENYPGADASWSIAANGQSGTQAANTGHGTFGLFGAAAFGPTYTFTLRVSGDTDDDFIGFALGYSPGEVNAGTSTNYLLIDWKRLDQTTGDNAVGEKGVALSHVTGTPTFDELWDHRGPVTELGRGINNWGTTGWALDTTYTVSITYTASTLSMSINGTQAFTVSAASFGTRFQTGFPDGQIVFYGLSQGGVTYTVTGPFGATKCNRAPTAADRTVVVASGTTPIATTVTTGFTDPDVGQTFNAASVRVVTQPTGATATAASGVVTVTPTSAAPGSQTFTLTYELCDNHPTVPLCDTATLTVLTGPSIANDSVSVLAGQATPITTASLLANDNNSGSNFSASFPTTTAHGTLSLNAGTLSYTPATNYFGADSFTYTLCNTTDTGVCRTATVNLTVNAKPVLAAASTCVPIGTTSVGLAVATVYSDADNGTLTRVAANAATGGTFSVNGTSLTFAPTAINVGATFALTYLACDNQTPEGCGTGNWNVTYNDPPVVTDVARIAARADVTNLAAGDYITNFGLVTTGFNTFAVSTAANGTFSSTVAIGDATCAVNSSGALTFTAGQTLGTQSCFVRACEACSAGGTGTCSVARIDVDVRDCLLSDDCDGEEVCDVSTSTCVDCLVDLDCSGGRLCENKECVACRDSATGSAVDQGCSAAFPVCTPNAGGPLCASFCGDGVRASDEACDDGGNAIGDGCSATCTVEDGFLCDIASPSECNRAPVADDTTVVLASGGPYEVAPSYADPDGDALASVEVLVQPDGATVTVVDGELVITPDVDAGATQFEISYQVCDSHPTVPRCDSATVTVVIGPNAVGDVFRLAQGSGVDFTVDELLSNDVNVSESLFTFDGFIDEPDHGALDYDEASGTAVYTPEPDFAGVDTATYILCSSVDGTTCLAASVVFEVNGLPQLRASAACVAVGAESLTLDVMSIFLDEDGLGTITPETIDQATLAVDDGTAILRFTPDDPALGHLYATRFAVCDGLGTPACATTTWDITYNDAPVLAPQTLTLAVGTPQTVARDTYLGSFGLIETGFVSFALVDGSCGIGPTGDITLSAATVGSGGCTIRVCETCTADGAEPACATTTFTYDAFECVGDGDCNGTVCSDNECESCEDSTGGDGVDRGCSNGFPVCVVDGAGFGCVSVCGDGVVASDEGCDDGGIASGDGCSNDCAEEKGFDCTGAPSQCESDCGDGVIASDELCDDGDEAGGDGCSATCTFEADWSCVGEPTHCNRPPTVDDYTVVLAPDAPIEVDPLDTFLDPDGTPADPDSVVIVEQPENGTVTVDDGVIVVTPDEPGGAQQFDVLYRVCDDDPAVALCDSVLVTIVIGPSGTDDELKAVEGEPTVTTLAALLANDGNVDDTLFSATVDVGPTENGTVSYDEDTDTITYTPNEGFSGSDSYTYELCSTADATTCVTVTVTIVTNRAPGFSHAISCVSVGTPSTTIDVAAMYSDLDGDALAEINSGALSGGALTLATTNLTFTPTNANVGARYALTYQGCDDGDPSACATGLWDVTYNDAPTFELSELTLVAGDSGTVELDIDYGVVATGFSTIEVAAAEAGPFGTTATLSVGSCRVDNGDIVVDAPTAGLATCSVRVCESCTPAGADPICAVVALPVRANECGNDDDCEDGEVCLGNSCSPAGSCGDGVVAVTEACDDGNADVDDGCTACVVDHGFECEGEPSECSSTCGDGVVASDEACDDHDTDSGDGCSDACAIEDGWACDGEPSECTPGCGDGIIVGSEACDDGDTDAGDGCSAACAIEDGWSCEGEPSVCTEDVVDDGFIAQGGGGCASAAPGLGLALLALLAIAIRKTGRLAGRRACHTHEPS